MGIHIMVSILPERIAPRDWEAAWDESLELLRSDPLGLMGITSEHIGDWDRLMYTRRIEVGADDPQKRHWHVVGDATTLETGESFVLYRDPGRYGIGPLQKRTGHGEPCPKATWATEILLALSTELIYPAPHLPSGVTVEGHLRVFGEKTQGLPFHEAMLAVGMLLEDRLRGAAVVHGDFDLAQAQAARSAVKERLGWELPMPMLTSPSTIEAALSGAYEGVTLVEAVETLSLVEPVGPQGNTEALKALWEAGETAKVQSWLRERLREDGRIDTAGGERKLVTWLNVTGDLGTLIDAVCLEEGGPKCDVLELTRVLAEQGITEQGEGLDVLDGFDPPKGTLHGVGALLFGTLLDWQLSVRRLQFRMTEAELLELLAERFPRKTKKLAQVVREGAASAKNRLEEVRAAMERLDGMLKSAGPPLVRERVRGIGSLGELDDEDRVVLQTVARHARSLGQDFQSTTAAKDLGTTLKNMASQYLAYCSKTQRLILSETTWGAIDEETDPEVLVLLMGLMGMKLTELSAYELRRGMLENPPLWKELIESSWNPETGEHPGDTGGTGST